MSYKLYTDKIENFECKLKLEGASLSKAFSRIILETNDINLSFENEKESGDLRDIVIAEVKQERISRKSDFIRIAKEMSILPMRLSKYCISTIHLNPEIKQNRFKKKLLFINKLKQA